MYNINYNLIIVIDIEHDNVYICSVTVRDDVTETVDMDSC